MKDEAQNSDLRIVCKKQENDVTKIHPDWQTFHLVVFNTRRWDLIGLFQARVISKKFYTKVATKSLWTNDMAWLSFESFSAHKIIWLNHTSWKFLRKLNKLLQEFYPKIAGKLKGLQNGGPLKHEFDFQTGKYGN